MTGKKMVEFTLPTFAFLDAYTGEGDPLAGRTVILHVRSASVIEILEDDDVFLKEGTLTYEFSCVNPFGVKEPMVAVLHYCATLDKDKDREMILNEIMKPAAQWYCDYSEWENENMRSEMIAPFN